MNGAAFTFHWHLLSAGLSARVSSVSLKAAKLSALHATLGGEPLVAHRILARALQLWMKAASRFFPSASILVLSSAWSSEAVDSKIKSSQFFVLKLAVINKASKIVQHIWQTWPYALIP